MLSSRARRRAAQRSAERARAVAEALHLVAEQDAEIPTTFHLRAADDRVDIVLSMGSPALFAGIFRADKVVDWMRLRAPGPPGFPAGARARPPRRTHSEWRDGEPGEAPTLVTPRGVDLVIEPGGGPMDTDALVTWIDGFPSGVSLVHLSREEIELRAGPPATEAVVDGARLLLRLSHEAPHGS